MDVGGDGANKRGVKRQADDSSLNDDLRFSKRFNLLSLDPGSNANSNYYIPASTSAPQLTSTSTTCNPNSDQEEFMRLDDTPDRVYVYNLDEELAEIEANEPQQKLIFLPDIEKQFSQIPHEVLTGRKGLDDLDGEGQELILYGAPKSLTVDERHDSVRKAIIEARQRARDKAIEDARREDMSRRYEDASEGQSIETAHGYVNGYTGVAEEDGDAMDLEIG